jgi:FADH2 O2-dependent halogenase
VTDDVAADLRLADGEAAWQRLLARYPSIAAQFGDARPIREFTWMPQLSWRAQRAAGPGWVMLPSAAAFVDPLFSTGIPLTLLGVERLAWMLEDGVVPRKGVPHEGDGYVAPHRGLSYADITLAEADHTARFIAGCYAAFPRFPQFAAYSMFYFAAASYAEMARRLDVHSRESRFLAADREPFAEALIRLSPYVREHDDAYDDDVARAIRPLNIAGLCDRAKRNWYRVDFDDTIRAAAKLGVTEQDVHRVCV